MTNTDKELDAFINSLTVEHAARRSLIDVTNEWDALAVEATVEMHLTDEQKAELLYAAAPSLDTAIGDDWENGVSSEWDQVTV